MPEAVLLLAVGRLFGPWNVVPPALWLACAGLVAGGACVAVLRWWPGQPLASGRRPWLRWVTSGATIAFSGVVLGYMAML